MKLNAVAFEGQVTFGIEVSSGDIKYERALAKLGAEMDRFRAAYGGYVKAARYERDRLVIVLTFGGGHNPDGYPAEEG